MLPGYGERLIRTSSALASAISATCRLNSDAFSLLTLAIAPRQPGRRSGPHKYASARTAQIALLAFFRAVESADSCAPHVDRSQSIAKAGNSIGPPARGWPAGTINVCLDHFASAETGSAWSITATTGRVGESSRCAAPARSLARFAPLARRRRCVLPFSTHDPRSISRSISLSRFG